MSFEPGLLEHPNIPKPLHTLAPRVIKGQEWWDVERKKAYNRAAGRCQACGVEFSKAKKFQRPEAHEIYDYDYCTGRLTFNRVVAICHYCHSFIHSGRLRALRNKNEISKEEYKEILDHGNKVLSQPHKKVINVKYPDGDYPEWGEYRMVIDGKEYGPAFNSFEEWRKFFNG